MSIKKNLNDALSQIEASEELDRRVMNSTINKNLKKIPFSKYKLAMRTLLIILAVFSSMVIVVSAKEYIFKYTLKKGQRDDKSYQQSVEITEPVNIIQPKDYTCDDVTTLSDMEKKLGVKFVFDTKKYNGKIDQCDIKINDLGKIESVKVRVSEFYDFSKDNHETDKEYDENFTEEEYRVWKAKRKNVDIYISFMTPNASNQTKREFKELGKMTGTSEIKNVKFYAENINTEGFYFILPSEKIQLSKTAVFTNNNIFYYLEANNKVAIEELLDIINEF